MEALKRNYSEKIVRSLQNFPAVALLGARQTGKTTLAKSIGKDFAYVDLENHSDFERLSLDPEFFIEKHENGVTLDEAQEFPDIFKILRGMIDKNRQKNGRFIITGSSSPMLLKQITESLAGRIAIIEISTLKANEIFKKPLSPIYNLFSNKLVKPLNFTSYLDLKQIEEAWFLGGYPEAVLKRDLNFYKAWMENYRTSYIERDIMKLFPRLNRLSYRRFLQTLTHLTSTIINKSDVARSVEVSEGTIRQYLNIAEGTFLWRNLNSFEQNIIKSIIKMPKGHFRDSGLLHFLLRINSLEDLYEHPIAGRSFESFVIEEIAKGLSATLDEGFSLEYFRTKTGLEIDLIISGFFGKLPIEIKKGKSLNLKRLKNLQKFIESQNLPFGVVINQAENMEWLLENIIQIPIQYW